MDHTYTQYTYTNGQTVDPVVATGVISFFVLFSIISYAIVAFFMGRIFKKAGVPQWAAWVPVYNHWKLLEIGNQLGLWAVLAFIPFVNIVSLIFTYIAMYQIGLKLQKVGAFVLLAIFLPLVWFIWLAFDDSKWPPAKKPQKPLFRKKAA